MSYFGNFYVEKLLKLLILCCCFLIVTIPLLVINGTYFPYIVQKTLYLQIFIEFIFVLYLILICLNTKNRPRRSYIWYSMLVFFAIMVITTLTSQSIFRSWWGNYERSLGTFTMLHFLLWFTVLAGVIKKTHWWKWLLNFSLFISLLETVYVFGQRFGWDFVLQQGMDRVNGTMGNASYVASYALIHLFLALFFLVESIKWRWKAVYLIIFLLNLTTLLLSGTRGAILALMASVVAFIGIVIWTKLWKQRVIKVIFITAVLMVIGFASLFLFKNQPFVEDSFIFRRISTFSLENNTVQTRLRSWEWGLKGFRDNLIVGVGPENYQIVFNKYFEPDFYDYTGDEIWFDRAHNTIVDMASTMGIFGLLTYLSLFGSAFYYLFYLKQKNILQPVSFLILSLLFFAYFVQNLFVFDSMNTYIIFFMLLAYIHFLYQNFGKNSEFVEKKLAGVFVALPLGIGLFLFLLLGINIPEIKANYLIYDAYVANAYNEHDKMIEKYYQAEKITLNSLDPAVLLSGSLSEAFSKPSLNISMEQKIQQINTAIDWMDKAISLDDKNMFLYYLQSKNYLLLTELSRDVKDLEKGIEFAKQADELSPGRVRAKWLLAQFYLMGGQPEKALEFLEEAERLNKNIDETYFYKSVVYKNMGNEEAYYQEINKIIDKNHSFSSAESVKGFLNWYKDKNDFNRLVYLYKELVRLEPMEELNWRNLIQLLNDLGMKDEADEYQALAGQKIPDFTLEE